MPDIPYSNGIKIRALNQDAGAVAVQSSGEKTFMLTRRRWAFMQAQWMEKVMAPNELVHVKCQLESGKAAVEIAPMGDSAATLVCQSNRSGTKTLRVGAKYVMELKPGEALMFYNPRIEHPLGKSGGAFAV